MHQVRGNREPKPVSDNSEGDLCSFVNKIRGIVREGDGLQSAHYNPYSIKKGERGALWGRLNLKEMAASLLIKPIMHVGNKSNRGCFYSLPGCESNATFKKHAFVFNSPHVLFPVYYNLLWMYTEHYTWALFYIGILFPLLFVFLS